MNTRFSMIKRITVATTLVALMSGMAYAADNSGKAQSFAEQNAYWQSLSTPMPHESPRVDRSVLPADPEPTAAASGGEVARFMAMDRTLQAESTPMPAGSPRVNRNEPAADPIPKATTLGQKESRFVAEDHFLQSMSTP